MRGIKLSEGVTVSPAIIVDMARRQELFASVPRKKPKVDPYELALIDAAQQVSKRLGLLPFMEDERGYYQALELVRQGQPPDRVAGVYSRPSNLGVIVEEEYPTLVNQNDRSLTHIAPTDSTAKSKGGEIIPKRMLRIAYSKGPHRWRKHEREALLNRRLSEPSTYRFISIGDQRLLLRVLEVDPTKESSHRAESQMYEAESIFPPTGTGTNAILEYFGFRDGKERGTLLRGFNGDAHHGADMVRAAYRIIATYRLAGSYETTPSRVKDIFSSVAFFIHMHGTGFTELLARTVGIYNLPELKGFSPMRVGSELYLVPRQDFQTLDARLRTSPKGIKDLPATMASFGYTKTEVRGIPVYRR